MAEKVALELLIEASESAKTVGELRKSIKDLKNEALAVGSESPEAFNALTKAASDAGERLKHVNENIAAVNPENLGKSFAKLGASIGGAFEVGMGASALFGAESENLEKQLVKIQAVMALTQGISEIGEIGKNFKLATTSVKAFGAGAMEAFKGVKGAIAATGIGLLVIALGTVVAYWDDIKAAVSGVSSEQKKLLADEAKSVKAAEDKLKSIEGQENLLRLQGKSEREILQMKVAATGEAIKGLEAQLITQEEVKKSQVETSERNKTILQNIIRLVTAPITLLLKGIDMAGEAFGKNFNLEEKFSGGLAGLIFNPEEVATEADATIKETRDKLEELKNQQAGFKLQIKEIDKKADDEKKAKEAKDKEERERKAKEELEAEKERLDALNALKEKNRQEEIQNLENQETELRNKKQLSFEQEREFENQKYILKQQQDGLTYEQLEALRIAHEAELSAIDDRQGAEALAKQKLISDAKLAIQQAAFSSLNSLGDLLINDQKKREKFNKAAALVQIGIDTATALSGAAVAAAKASAAAGNPIAGFAVYASVVAQVLGNMAKAKALLGASGSSGSAGGGASGGGGGNAPQRNDDVARIAEANTGRTNLETPTVKAVVVETDITSTQKRVNSIEEKASI